MDKRRWRRKVIVDLIIVLYKAIVFLVITVPKKLWQFFKELYRFLFKSKRRKKQESVYGTFFDYRSRREVD